MTTAPDRPIVDEPLLPGTLLDGRYRLGALIGRGGVASVHRADDTALGRSVAVKLFDGRTEGLHDPARRARETALLASVTHPALVTLFDAGHDPTTGREYLVMEFVDGPDLSRRFADGPLAPSELAALVRELAEGLYVIHSRGIVHRDVKPANVLLAPTHLPTREWHPKLADFGIARLIDDAGLTATGQLLGTPAYLSPEQVRGQGADAAADVYALGLVALEAATGQRVYDGPAIEAASARLVRDPEVPEWLGAGWHDLLTAMVAQDREARPTALDVAVRVGELPLPGERPTDPAEAPTVAMAPTTEPPGDDSAVESPVNAAAEAVDAPTLAVDAPTAATLLLPSASATVPARSLIETELPDAEGAPVTRPRRETAPSDRSPRHRRRIGLVAAALAVVALVVTTVAILTSTLLGGAGGAGTDASTPPMPTVEGELGVHLEQLEEAVTP
ncbi:serine/threonine-protein kinase [Agromyces sp. MMS24-K17]|uniref:serine/threonine-protein kinase n=1 Tax=Agromyces sp. MMS24-K17 TaxID=3372850 RepID=UPI00375484F2